jgi:hypothetical protein
MNIGELLDLSAQCRARGLTLDDASKLAQIQSRVATAALSRTAAEFLRVLLMHGYFLAQDILCTSKTDPGDAPAPYTDERYRRQAQYLLRARSCVSAFPAMPAVPVVATGPPPQVYPPIFPTAFPGT